MKCYIYYGIVILLGTFLSVSCSSNHSEETPKSTSDLAEESFRSELTSLDSLSVINLADSIMNLFKKQQIDEAVKNIFELSNEGTISNLSASREKSIRRQFAMFPVYDYKITNLQFNTADQNLISFQIIFEEPIEGKSPSVTNFALSPVKNDGKWYMTIRQSSSGDGHDSWKID